MAVDPRLKVITKQSVNNKLAQRGIRHSTYLERYKNHEAQKIVGLLNEDVIPDLLNEYYKRLSNITTRGYDTSANTTKRLQQLIKATDGLSRGLISQVGSVLSEDMRKLSLVEAEWQVAGFTDLVPIKIDFITPSPRLLQSIVTERPFDGHLMKDWWSKIADDVQHKTVQQLQIGMTRGESTESITKRISDTMQSTRRNAEAVTRTAVTHVTTQAREVTFEENGDVVDKVQMVATLDDRTTEICMAQDGETYPVNSGPRPPFHYGCRTVTVPVTKSWKDLGLDFNELEPGTRASMNGQVSSKLTYGDWLRTQTEAVQNEALGPSRADLFRNGRDIKSFVNDKGKLLTLDELKAKD